ncbi:ribonuclease H-like domain-containing protein [Tanacetum coccineum]
MYVSLPTKVCFGDFGAFWSLAGSLQYLTFTRPDLSYAVRQVCLFMHDPREQHLATLKRILRYVRGTLDYGLQLFSASPLSSVGYFDADWAGCPTTRQSTSMYCVSWQQLVILVLQARATLVYYDNVSAVNMSSNPVQHQRTKHIDIGIYFLVTSLSTRPSTAPTARGC